jgi:hypothetical protein
MLQSRRQGLLLAVFGTYFEGRHVGPALSRQMRMHLSESDYRVAVNATPVPGGKRNVSRAADARQRGFAEPSSLAGLKANRE